MGSAASAMAICPKREVAPGCSATGDAYRESYGTFDRAISSDGIDDLAAVGHSKTSAGPADS